MTKLIDKLSLVIIIPTLCLIVAIATVSLVTGTSSVEAARIIVNIGGVQ